MISASIKWENDEKTQVKCYILDYMCKGKKNYWSEEEQHIIYVNRIYLDVCFAGSGGMFYCYPIYS